jgi:hypothetical protein
MDESAIRATAVGLLLAFGPRAFGEQQDPSTYAIYVAEQLTYDDNLYGLPSNADVAALAGPHARRQDLIDSVSLGADVHWFSGHQAVGVDFRVDDNRFSHNDALNNTSGIGNLVWDWRLGGNLSGQAGADYYRALVSFANTNYYARDLVERVEYFGIAWDPIGRCSAASSTRTPRLARSRSSCMIFTASPGTPESNMRPRPATPSLGSTVIRTRDFRKPSC